MKRKMKKIYVGCIILTLVLLLGGAAWLIWSKMKPADEGVQVAKNSLGIEWYDENATEFTITTVEQFLEFRDLADYYDFEGQTVKLGADLVFNEGNAEDWMEIEPALIWESIYGFAGTFDGQGHTISGVYGIGYLYRGATRGNGTDYVTAGLFRNTQENCVIKNFRLVNSLFISDLNYGTSAISSYGGGTFESIYTDAIIYSQKRYVGGIIGKVSADTTVTNCWFDGSIEIVGNYGRYDGGIAGRVEANKNLTIDHCLVSGTLVSDLYKKGVNMGGMVGNLAEYSTVTINDSLVSGKVVPSWTSVVGSVIGNLPARTTVKASDLYVTADTYKKIIGYHKGTLEGSPIAFDREVITGLGGYQWTTLDFENYWAVVEDGTPVLKTFADNPLSIEGVAKKVDTSWYNEEDKEFVLTDAADLYGFALLSYRDNFEGKTVKLGADIAVNEGKASAWAKEAPENAWICIGSASNKFAGTFDGQMHTVSGVYLKTEDTYRGFFADTAATAVVKNFRLTNSYFESDKASFGSIAGRAMGTFDTIYSSAIVVGSNSNIGGMLGQVPTAGGVTVKNCWFDGSVTNTAEKDYRRTGGIIGCIYSDSTITNCLNTGKVDASAFKTREKETKNIYPYVGGIVGYIRYAKTTSISSCFNAGDILVYQNAEGTTVTSRYGSILGYANGSTTTVSDCFATTESSNRTANGSSKYLFGKVLAYPKAQLNGYGGYQWTTLDFVKHWAVVLSPDKTPILKAFAGRTPSVSGVARMLDTSWYNEKESTFVLYDLADLNGFALLSGTKDFAGKTVKLGADITVNTGNAADWATNAPAFEWLGIGSEKVPFSGTFDGQGHTISGIYLKTDAQYSGLFNATEDKTVLKNFSLKNSYLESSNNSFASIVGRAKGTFDTIYSDAIVVGSLSNVGGIIGQIPTSGNVTMTNCWFDGSVTNTSTEAGRRTGGLIGCAFGNIAVTNCLNTGTIDVSAYCKQEVSSSTGKATSNVYPYAGGLVGYIRYGESAKISDCLNTGKVLAYTDPNGKLKVTRHGSVVGFINGTKTTIEDTFATSESSKYDANTSSAKYKLGQVIVYDEEKLVGNGGYQWTTLDFDKYWAVVLGPDQTPILKSFATTVPSITVARMIDMKWYTKNPSADTYVIEDMDDLYGLALLSGMNDFSGKTIQLGKDIVVNTGNAADWATTAPEYAWFPIGSASLPFAGTFDGNGKSISGLYLKSDDQYQGFFGMTVETAVIKNFSLLNSYFESSNNSVGSIAGRGVGTFTTVYSDAIVVGSLANVGGLIGQVTVGSATLTDCWFDGSVTNPSTEAGKRTGGLVGCVFSSVSISNCLNTGTVDVSAYTLVDDGEILPLAGGFVGYIKSSDKAVISTITGSLNTGEVKVYNSSKVARYGSIMGYANASNVTITDTYATTESCVNTASGSTGYVEGTVLTYPEAIISGYGGYQWTTLNFAETDGYWAVVTSPVGTPILQSFATTIPSLEGYAKLYDTSWYDGENAPEGTAEDPYALKDKEDVYGLAVLSSTTDFAGKKIVLTADIAFNNGIWMSIGGSNPFAGTFDGQGHTISGVNSVSGSANGLFAKTAAGSMICNLKVVDSHFECTATAKTPIGSIVGELGGDLKNIYSNATVTAAAGNAGGLVGVVDTTGTSKISECWYDGAVTVNSAKAMDNNQAVGGLVGGVLVGAAEIENCISTGDITCTYASPVKKYNKAIGGLVGLIVTSDATLSMTDVVMSGEMVVRAGEAGSYTTFTGNTSSSNAGDIDNGRGINLFVGYGAVVIKDAYGLESANDYGFVQSTSAGSENYQNRLTEQQLCSAQAYSLTKDTLSYYDETENPTGVWIISKDGPRIKGFAEAVDPGQVALTDWYYKTENYDKGGNTFTIRTVEELYTLGAIAQTYSFENDTIMLLADTEYKMNEGLATDWKDGKNVDALKDWTPVGSSDKKFMGTFDGNGSTISGIYVKTGEANTGLFGYIDGATLKNFHLENSYIENTMTSGNAQIGSIAGYANTGTMQAIYSNAIVVAHATRVGGFAGYGGQNKAGDDYYLNLESCWFAGEIICDYAGVSPVIGGFVGYSRQVSFDTCLCTGTIDWTYGKTTSNKVNTAIGGFAGNQPTSGAYNLKIARSISAPKITINLEKVNSSCYADRLGTVLGYAVGNYTFDDVYSIGKITVIHEDKTENFNYVYGRKESQAGDGTDSSIEVASDAYGAAATDKFTELFFTEADRTAYDGGTAYWSLTEKLPIPKALKVESVNTAWYYNTENYDKGGNTFTINTVDELYGLASIAQTYSFANDTINLAKDKTFAMNIGKASEWAKGNKGEIRTWTPIGTTSVPFKGTFNGNGSTISGIYMTTDTANAGLFGYTDGATLKNFRLENSYFTTSISGSAQALMGSIAGQIAGEDVLENIYSDAIVATSGTRVAGFVGAQADADAATITNCWFAGQITITQETANTEMNVGGFVGYVRNMTFTNCLVDGTFALNCTQNVSGTKSCTIGGFVGTTNSSTAYDIKFINCLSAANMNITSLNSGMVFRHYGTYVGRYRSTSTYTFNNAVSIGAVTVDCAGTKTIYLDACRTNTTAYFGDKVIFAVTVDSNDAVTVDYNLVNSKLTSGWTTVSEYKYPIPAALKK